MNHPTTRETREASVPRCCGEHYPGEKGGPLILACKLCRNSRTFWDPNGVHDHKRIRGSASGGERR